MKFGFASVVSVVAAVTSNALAQLLPITLYAGDDPRPPEQQSWLYFTDHPIGSAARSTQAGRTSLSTLNSAAIVALYSTRTYGSGPGGGAPHPLVLSRSTGFSFSLDMRIITEVHDNTARGGYFQQIRTSSSAHGIMLFGWEDRLFTWTPQDEIGEMALVDLQAQRTVTTTIFGDAYSVLVDGQTVMSGPLRNYLDADIAQFPSSSIAFGDFNMSSAVEFEFSRATINPIPEPAALFGAVFLGVPVARRRRHAG